MSIDVRLNRLLEDGRLGQALRFIAQTKSERSLTIAEQVIYAELLADLTSSDSALELAVQIAKRPEVKKAERARCLAVAGASRLRAGDRESGLEFFQRARACASEVPGHSLACRIHLAWFAALAAWVSPEAASSELATARWLVNAAGEPRYTIRFHIILAEMEAKRGLLPRARHHLSIAEGLLERFPNLFLSAELSLRAAAVAALSSDLAVALKESQRSLSLAQECDAVSLEVVARSNFGHALLTAGRVDEAVHEFRIALRLCRLGGGAEIGIRDGLMQASLIADRVDETSRLAEELEQLSSRLDEGHSYYGLWHLLTRVRWLFRRSQANEGAEIALAAIPFAKDMADSHLLGRMQLLAAEGLGRTGRARDGAELLAEAVQADLDTPLEMLGEASRVAGWLAGTTGASSAASHLDRADRILACAGHVSARRDAAATAREMLRWVTDLPGASSLEGALAQFETESSHLSFRRVTDGAFDDPSPRAVEGAGAAVELGAHPVLLGQELMRLAFTVGAARAAALHEIHHDGRRRVLERIGCDLDDALALGDAPDATRISLGTIRDIRCEVAILGAESVSARMTMLSLERLARASLELYRFREREREEKALWPEQSAEQQLGMVFASEVMTDLVKTMRRVATTNLTVLITGETGTGKELLARAVHQSSRQGSGPFVPFNCTAVARDMIDAQLFGYRRGAFTGAIDAFQGVIRAAEGGTLFLDEIGEIGLDVQPKLLRFLESGEVHPLGEPRPIAVDVRVVAATNANLELLVSNGRFREDLFYRLDVIRLHVPPLRERREEIPLLVEHFLSRSADDSTKFGLCVAEETMEYLVLYRWPGNVRQLVNEMSRLVALAESGAVLMPEHLSREIASSRRTVSPSERQLTPSELVVRIDQPMSAATEHLERAMIEHAMRRVGGRLEDAARILGVSRKGLYLKRQRFGIQ